MDRGLPTAVRLRIAEDLEQIAPACLRRARARHEFEEIVDNWDLKDGIQIGYNLLQKHLENFLLLKLRNLKSSEVSWSNLRQMCFDDYDTGDLEGFCDLVTELTREGNVSPKSFDQYNVVFFTKGRAIKTRLEREVKVLSELISQGDALAERQRSRLRECISIFKKNIFDHNLHIL